MAKRLPAKVIALPAALLASWIAYEGFSPTAYIPTKGDRPTIGHGSTFYEDGRPVTLQDTPITRKRASELAAHELEKTYAACVRASLGTTLISETEFKVAIDFAGQYGCGAWKSGKFVQHLKNADYKAYCNSFLAYRYMTSDARLGPQWEPYRTSTGKLRYRFDCSTPGNKQCRGVWSRQVERNKECLSSL